MGINTKVNTCLMPGNLITAASLLNVYLSSQTGGLNVSTKRNERFTQKVGTFAESVAAGPKRVTHIRLR